MLCSPAAVKYLLQKAVTAVKGGAIPSWRRVRARQEIKGEPILAASGWKFQDSAEAAVVASFS